jgi:hypothetical protein
MNEAVQPAAIVPGSDALQVRSHEITGTDVVTATAAAAENDRWRGRGMNLRANPEDQPGEKKYHGYGA